MDTTTVIGVVDAAPQAASVTLSILAQVRHRRAGTAQAPAPAHDQRPNPAAPAHTTTSTMRMWAIPL